MARNVCRWLCVAVLACGVALVEVEATCANEDPVARQLDSFAHAWPPDRVPYRTPEDTTTWKVYARTMKSLVAMGNDAVPGLIKACDHPNYQVRALAARVLGYLKATPAVPKLIALLNDQQAPVALHAADSLGQIQDPRGLEALKKAQAVERRGDVMLHIAKALERQTPLEKDVVEQILLINDDSVDSARIGERAPDFSLKDPSGRTWKLSDFRGKKAVVLVFIYGDG